MKSYIKNTHIIFLSLLIFACEPIATEFDDIEDAVMYQSASVKEFSSKKTIKVMTWNIRFGVARLRFFGDGCGDKVIMTKSEVITGLKGLAAKIIEEDPDILLLQEVDVQSKKTSYIDQAQWLLDNTDMNYGAYASMWQAQAILADGLGRVNTGNLILSKWKLENAERIQLPLRGDQDGLTKYFYLRRNVLKALVDMPGNKFYAVNTHLTAFATDDTKQKHIDTFYNILSSIDEDAIFVAGGDLNALTPNAEQRDFCYEDKCQNQICDGDYENNEVYQASYFNHLDNEEELLLPLYNDFYTAFNSLNVNQNINFTHSTWNENENIPGDMSSEYWNRKLDYIFSSHPLIRGYTHQDQYQLSDHAPVSVVLEIE